ncbi:MAG: DNA repair protein RecN, partial [Actinobacteria bacterium]|nr:DNA repair protein RecN [Actinomycetota bacterium]
MLRQLRVRNFALIADVDLRLGPGLNVLTGETGAGKSILIDALGLLLGRRADPADVRTGCDEAYVEGIFALPAAHPVYAALAEVGVPADDDLVIAREVARVGRSVARVGGRAVPARVLVDAGRHLIDVHGQTEHQSLFQRARQLGYLDRYGGLDGARTTVSERARSLRAIRGEIAALQADERAQAREVDLLSYQIEEIEGARLQSNEDADLATERQMLTHAERLRALAAEALGVIERDQPPGALDALGLAQRNLQDIARLDPGAARVASHAAEAAALTAELARDVAAYADAVEVDPARLAEVEVRLQSLDSLKRKYGDTLAEVLEFAQRARERLASLTSREARLQALAEAERQASDGLARTALELSHHRARAGAQLAQAVRRELGELGMPHTRFALRLAVRPDPAGVPVSGYDAALGFDETGIDQVEFELSVNPGEPPRGLAQVASGGEVSRVLLGLKSVLAGVDETPVLVFDEIEAGVGGRGGDVVGQKLARLATSHQVLCVTHLPTVAAYADAHFVVTKATRAGTTLTEVRRIEGDQVTVELAAMSGAHTAAAADLARE